MRVPDEKIELLRAGQVEAWNAWRFSDLGTRYCLSQVDLRGARLAGVALWRMEISDCVFDGADLSNADLRESSFRGSSFGGADMSGAACWTSRFDGCDLTGARVDSANFEHCGFDGSVRPEGLAGDDGHQRWYWLHSPQQPGPPPLPRGAAAIALLGDCTVHCGYVAPSARPGAVLARCLNEGGIGKSAFVYDLSRDGESLAGLLGRYDKVLSLDHMAIAFVRYGVADRKEYGGDRFIQLLGELCGRLERDFADLQIVMETGMYVDYPAHYPFDRNAKLSPLYDRARSFAADRGYRVVDVYGELENRTTRGDWDWRIRGLGIGRPASLHDAGQDHLHDGEPDWFFNIHPNHRCIQLVGAMERDVVADILVS